MRVRPKPHSAGDAVAAVREKFANKWSWVNFDATTFYDELPTPAERECFAVEFRETFLEMFGFVASEYDHYPTGVWRAFGCCVFRREYSFFEERKPLMAFEAPDLRGVAYRQTFILMTRARAEWWRVNKWTMTPEETAWLQRGGPQQTGSTTSTTVLPVGAKEGQ
jgi:hypothetical protein